MRGLLRVCPHRLDPHASVQPSNDAHDRSPKSIEPQKLDAPVDDCSVKSRHRFVYMRRRPMHPGRFLAFTRQRFGPLGILTVDDAAAEAAAAAASPKHQSIGDEPVMMCQPCGVSAEAGDRPVDRMKKPSLVTEARGCLWFVFSDDVQALWRFDCPKVGGPGTEKADGSQLLRVGLPWDATGGAEKGRQAGVRRVELTFLSKGMRTDGVANIEAGESSDVDEAWRLEECALRTELDACLVTRDEAVALESGEPLEGMEEWETLRLGHEHMAPWVEEWLPVLRPLYRTVELLSRLPGIGVAGALGRAINARARGFVPHGHA